MVVTWFKHCQPGGNHQKRKHASVMDYSINISVNKSDQMVASSLQTKSIKWKQKVPPTPQSGNIEFSYITNKEHENIQLKLFYELVAKGLLNELR
jgi:hypothetical protein